MSIRGNKYPPKPKPRQGRRLYIPGHVDPDVMRETVLAFLAEERRAAEADRAAQAAAGEAYAGIKFDLDLAPGLVPPDPRNAELIRWCRRFDARGLTPRYPGGAHGNLSYRRAPGGAAFVITATQCTFDRDMTEADLVCVEAVDPVAGAVRAVGVRAPSSETLLHAALYAAFPDAHAVVHGHSDLLLAHAGALGLPCTAREVPYGSRELAEAVLAVAGAGPVVIMTGHGFVARGADLDAAGRAVVDLVDRVLGRAKGGRA